MKIDQIIYLEDIAQTHSITQSAQRLFISQQSLSFSIKKLEEEFGAHFLNRTNHGVELTEDGRHFLQRAGSMVTLYQQIKAEFLTADSDQKGQQPSGTLQIFCHTRLLEPLLVDLLSSYTKRYPQVTVLLNEQENLDTITAIAQGQGDLGLIFLPEFLLEDAELPSGILPDTARLEKLFADEFVVCCRNTHPLNNGTPLCLGDLTQTPVALFDTNPYVIGQTAIRDKNTYYSNNTAFHQALIAQGLAISVITGFEFRKLYFKHKDITALPLNDHLKSVITLVLPAHQALSPAAQLFADLLRKYDFYGL